MNIILVLIDSMNRHALAAYGQSTIATPNIDRFANRAWRFDNHFVGSLPCMPARREIFAGFKELMWRPWGPLEPFDARLPRLLEADGYSTALITDHYHYWEEAANGYMQSFQSTELIRGHEGDYWHLPSEPAESVPQWVDNIAAWRPGAAGRRYFANIKNFQNEEDYFPARVMSTATDWITSNHSRAPFFLQIESFDVHEPFQVPEPYASMYGDATGYERFTVWPPYQNPQRMREFLAQASSEEMAFIRSQYAGKLTMVDKWFGQLLQSLDEHELWDDTVVIVTTDHGHDLGEHGQIGKQHPHYDSHANIPLFIWHPSYPTECGSVSDLTSTVDIFATALDIAGVPVPERTHSQNLIPLLDGQHECTRSAVLYGSFGQGVCLTDGEWTIIKAPEVDGPLYSYSALQFRSLVYDNLAIPVGAGRFIPGVELPQWQVPLEGRKALTTGMLSNENYLFHRTEDPEQSRNLWKDAPEQRKRMLELLRKTIEEEGAPIEQYERLGLQL